MKAADTLRLALLFMVRRKVRTVLTVLGVVIGTVCIVLMLSIGVSNYSQLQDMIGSRSSLTEIRVTQEGRGLSRSEIDQIGALAHVRAASPLLRLPGRLTAGVYEATVSLTGILPEVLDVQFALGGMFAPDARADELVVGGDARRDFVDPAHPPDYSDWEAFEAYEPAIDWLADEFTFLFGYGSGDAEEESAQAWLDQPGIPMRVSGVTETQEYDGNGSIYIGLEAAREILLKNAEQAETMGLDLNRYGEALVRADSMDNVEDILHAIRDMGFEASGDLEYIREMRAEQNRQLMQLLALGLISLLVSAIGIANTMYAGVLERHRDIGVLKVLGMRSAGLRKLFVTEAACLGILGGLIGLGAAWLAVAALNAGMVSGMLLGMYFDEGSRITIPFWIGGGALLIAAVTGILAGLWPAAHAAQMSPLAAMRAGR